MAVVTFTSVCTGLTSFFQAHFARIMAGMHQEDSYAVFSGDDSDPVSSGKYIGTFVFTAPVAEPTVVSFTVPLDDCTVVATTIVVTSYSSSADCSGAARVFASRCRVVVVLLLAVLTILFGTV